MYVVGVLCGAGAGEAVETTGALIVASMCASRAGLLPGATGTLRTTGARSTRCAGACAGALVMIAAAMSAHRRPETTHAAFPPSLVASTTAPTSAGSS